MQSVSPLVDTMVYRSQKFVLQGKTIAVVGAGGMSKRFIWPEAMHYGIKVINLLLVKAHNTLVLCPRFWSIYVCKILSRA